MRCRAVLVVSLVLGVVPWAADAQAPSCDATSVGLVACFESKLCACMFERGGTMTGRARGYRWDCGILRPGCGGDATTPATTGGYAGELPAAVGLDRSQTVITNQAGRANLGQVGDGAVIVLPPPVKP
jgi:hypothetical protein